MTNSTSPTNVPRHASHLPIASLRARSTSSLTNRLSPWDFYGRETNQAPPPSPTDDEATEPERAPDGWEDWLTQLFPQYCTAGFAPHHQEFWEWVWTIRPGTSPRPFVAVWPRGGAKSTSIELACVVLGSRQARSYILYVCGSQEQADNHVATVASMLESSHLERIYPLLGQRSLTKYGQVKGWRRNRLWTASGLIVDALGLDTAARGVKLEAQRPDLIVLDDIDTESDTLATADRHMRSIARKLIPAGSTDVGVVAVQNLVIPHGVFSRLANHAGAPKSEILSNRIISGPIPAVVDLEYEESKKQPGRYHIVAGHPSWEGQDIATCERQLNAWGPSAFLAEAQHEVDEIEGGIFAGVEFRTIEEAKLPDLYTGAVWVDPAVTDTDHSDSHGISAASVGMNGVVYIRYSWEGRTSPLDSLKRAISKAVELGIDRVGVETDQGGDTWYSVYQQACYALGIPLDRAPRFVSEKAGAGFGSKVHRASQMLGDFERARIVLVEGTHTTLIRGLRRFGRVKPYDLVDATFWSWDDCRKLWAASGPNSGPRYAEVLY